MKSETLQLLAPLTDTTALNLARVLNAVEGVSQIATASNSVDIHFNEDVTSTQVLRTVLQRAGFDVKKPAHGEEGSCCGSCG